MKLKAFIADGLATLGWFNRSLIDAASRHPFLLILLFGISLLLTFIAIVFLSLISTFTPPSYEDQLLIYGYSLSAACIWSYYIYLSFRTTVVVLPKTSEVIPVYRVAQLIGSSVFAFAVLHYYVAIFSDMPAYYGLTLAKPTQSRSLLVLLFFRPSVRDFVDLLYFSASTTATVGYGDIHPQSVMAKLLTTIQMIFSFVLVAVVLGWRLGHAPSIKK